MLALTACLCTIPQAGSAQEPPTPTILLSSGPSTGAYHRTSVAIADALNEQARQAHIEVVPSSGSGENLDRLREGLTDWAVVQRDVAVDAYYASDRPFRRLNVRLPLFPEAVQVFVRRGSLSNEGEPTGLSGLVEALRTGDMEQIAIGPAGSGSARTARKLFALYGLSGESEAYLEAPYARTFDLFSRGEVDALMVTWAFPGRPFQDFRDVRLLSLTRRDVARIRDHLPHLDPVTIPGGAYPYANGPTPTVGTWALLVARRGAEAGTDRQVSSLVGPVLRSMDRDPRLGLVAGAYSAGGSLRVVGADEGVRLAMAPGVDAGTFFRGLPLHPELAGFVEEDGAPPFAVAAAVGLLVVVLLIGWWRWKKIRAEEVETSGREFGAPIPVKQKALGLPGPMKELWIRHKHYVYGLLFLAIIFLVTGIATKHFEQQFSQTHLIQSPFGHRSLGEIWHWLLIYSVSGYTGGVFPVSPVAKVAASMLMPLTWVGVGCAVVGEFLFRQRRKRRLSGMEPISYEDHVVVCGWNDRVPVLIRKCLTARDNFVSRDRDMQFVVLDERFESALDEHPDLATLHKQQEMDYIAGDAKGQRFLEKANVSEADTVILVADERTHHADEHTLLRALAISRYCRRVADQAVLDNIYIIAELNNEEYKETLLESDVNEVISPPDLSENILIQSTFNHGLSEIIHSLLNYNTANEFYLVDVADHNFLTGRTFDEALVELRSVKILLVAIKVVFTHNGCQVIDRKEIQHRLEEIGLERQVVTNPIFDQESGYRIREDDQLFVLARDEAAIRDSLEELRGRLLEEQRAR